MPADGRTQHTQGIAICREMIPGRAGSHEHACMPACRLTVASVCKEREREGPAQQQQGGLLGWEHTAVMHGFPSNK